MPTPLSFCVIFISSLQQAQLTRSHAQGGTRCPASSARGAELHCSAIVMAVVPELTEPPEPELTA